MTAAARIEAEQSPVLESLAQIVGGSEADGRAGYLVFNPIGVARRAAVLLPDAQLDLRPEGPLRVAQFTDEGVWAIVDLPAFRYAWVPQHSLPDSAPASSGALGIKGRVLRNDYAELEVDEATGGIRSIKALGEPTARLGQQLTAAGLVGPDGNPVASRMRSQRFETEYGGPALVQAESRGQIVDSSSDRVLAQFAQRYRLWSGRPIVELEISLSELDPAWSQGLFDRDPWEHYLACRWAWPDPSSAIRRSALLHPEATEAERPETPDAFDIFNPPAANGGASWRPAPTTAATARECSIRC